MYIKNLLKTTAALATLIAGSQSWGATFNEATVSTVSTTGAVSVTVAGAATTVAPTIPAAGANDSFIHIKGASKDGAATDWNLANTSACLLPVTQVFQVTSAAGAATLGVTVPTVAPGDLVKIFDATLLTGARTLAVSAFAYGTNWTEENKIKYAAKVATVEWFGPYEPAFLERAGVAFKYKKTTTAEVQKALRP